MKFNLEEVLYYVCPFVFKIELVQIEFYDGTNKEKFYIEKNGAYIKEECLFRTLDEAKDYALEKLQDFYYKKVKEISNSNPQWMED